jgi:hypothetical protein
MVKALYRQSAFSNSIVCRNIFYPTRNNEPQLTENHLGTQNLRLKPALIAC